MTGDADVDPLTRLAIHYGTDKWAPHVYTPIYHAHFSHLRDKPVRLLEIGVGGYGMTQLGGESLRMWADYFRNGQIVGFDIEEKSLDPHPRITVLRGSQDDPVFLAQVIADHGPFDIVIDDGSHLPEHMVASFKILFPAVTDPGFYVIEDLLHAFELHGGSLGGSALMQLANDIVVNVNSTGEQFGASIRALHSYRNLRVIERGATAEPATLSYDLGDAEVARAMSAVEREMQDAPSPDGLAHLARLYVNGRAYSKALLALRRGLEQWPDHFHLLLVATRFSGRAGDPALKERCAEKLLALAPDDPFVRKICRKVPSR